MKTFARNALLASTFLMASAGSSQANPTSFSLSADYVTEYVFRGTTLAGEAFQPGAELAFGDFTAGVWASIAVGEESIAFDDEIDFYASYTFAPTETISLDVGATLYHYPQSGGVLDIGTGAGDASTLEFFGSASFDAPLEPTFTVNYDITLETLTVIGTAGYSFPISENTSFDLGATAGHVETSGAGDYTYGILSGALSFAMSETSSFYVSANFGISSDDTFADIDFDPANPFSVGLSQDNSFWLGIGFSSGF
ncbi:MAG: hypothetical protein COA47_03930 [Robiginitomaculum sp.]|nr:MAG: hypothetical protein COA47_03930 [Robiginitomaculum sp.]